MYTERDLNPQPLCCESFNFMLINFEIMHNSGNSSKNKGVQNLGIYFPFVQYCDQMKNSSDLFNQLYVEVLFLDSIFNPFLNSNSCFSF